MLFENVEIGKKYRLREERVFEGAGEIFKNFPAGTCIWVVSKFRACDVNTEIEWGGVICSVCNDESPVWSLQAGNFDAICGAHMLEGI